MRKLRLFAHISLDGVIAPGAPDDSSDFANGGWTGPFRSPAGAAMLAEIQGNGFDLLLGRRTYDLWSGYWPKMKGGPFSDNINGAKKYVATHRPDSLAWGPVESLGDDVPARIRRLKSQDGPDLLVWGSSTLIAALFHDELVDDVVLLVYPVVLGRGVRFFSDDVDPRELALVESKTSPTGVIVNTYRHVGSLRNRITPTA